MGKFAGKRIEFVMMTLSRFLIWLMEFEYAIAFSSGGSREYLAQLSIDIQNERARLHRMEINHV